MAVETKLEDIEKKLDKFIESADVRYCPAHIVGVVDNNCRDIDSLKKGYYKALGAISFLFTIINIVIALYL